MSVINAFPNGMPIIAEDYSDTSINGILKGNGSKIQKAVPGIDYQAPVALASADSNGLLSSTLFTKITGIDEGANKYVLPLASESGLGGIKIGSNLSIDTVGVLSVSDASVSNSGVVTVDSQSFAGEKTFVNKLKVSNTTESTSTTSGAVTIAGGLGVAGTIYGNKVLGAVYNDYAEFRSCLDHVVPGNCVAEVGDDTVTKSDNRLINGAMIVSDTYGFCIGIPTNSVPIAVAGRVLAYPYESIDEFRASIGMPVCSGPNGTVSIMSELEARDNPWAIIGTVSSVPEYSTWGMENILVDGRVWIKIK